ncbi:hypothetical protein GZH49_34250 [Nocardia terpenica]|uniref:hypothetical protein n=1 Tax=Nocardia terpenica TaxID=455432 RepID=UPI002FDF76F5
MSEPGDLWRHGVGAQPPPQFSGQVPMGSGDYGPPPAIERRGGRGWLWGLGGVVVASVVWGAAVVATGGFGGSGAASPDLRGYHYIGDLCSALDISPFTSVHFSHLPSDDTHHGSQHPVRDLMGCSSKLKPAVSTDRYDNTNLYTSVTLHKKTDPAPEFAADADTAASNDTDAGPTQVQRVSGLGDEAYYDIRYTSGSDFDVSLNVREGWMTMYQDWYGFGLSGSTVTQQEITDALRESVTATLATLRK